jgi:hypothetical protein
LAPDADDIAKVDKVLATIAKDLSEKEGYALSDINELINQNLIVDDDTDDRAALHQLTFSFLGWLSRCQKPFLFLYSDIFTAMLYDPRLDCKHKKLQVSKFTLKTDGNKADLQSRIFDTQSQDLEYVDQSLHLLLGRFGKIIPDLPLRRRSEVAPPSEWIVVPFVCYQTLRTVGRVEIEWVDALGMHLEFDSNRRVLKIFRFPSFCRLMYKHKQRGLLSQYVPSISPLPAEQPLTHVTIPRLFDDKERDIRGDNRRESFITSDYLREMLLTYRLIFGQDAKSSRRFAKELATLAAASKPSRSASQTASQKSRQPCIFALPDADPLLTRLCGLRANATGAAEIYVEIGASRVQSYYTPQSYPFFAEKLLVLQAYVKEQHPHDLKTLWYDNRNKTNWWQFWAVLFIGGMTIVLSVLSLVFQIWQAVLTQQQLLQGQQQNSGPAASLVGDI